MPHNTAQALLLDSPSATVDPGALPPMPKMPTQADRDRVAHQTKRFLIVEETWDEQLTQWHDEHVDGEITAAVGPVDTSANPLVDIAMQLTTPGLYGVRPKTTGSSDSARRLVGEGGHMDRVRYFTKMQRVQFYVVALGDFLVRLSVDVERKVLIVRLVPPHLIYARAKPDAPDRPVELWELRPRLVEKEGSQACWIWAWDQFSIDPDKGEPFYKVISASTVSGVVDFGEDLSGMFLQTAKTPSGILVGADYPFVDGDTPFLPWVWYRSFDDGTLWRWRSKRGTFRGTLQVGLNWTYAQRAARSASGPAIFVVGADRPATQSRKVEGGRVIESIAMVPGSATFLKQSEGATQIVFHESGSAENLDSLRNHASDSELRVAVREGLSPADVQRVSNNPMSGAALFISSGGRRRHSRKVEPTMRDSDLDAFQKSAALLTASGVDAIDTDRDLYSITYVPIPLSPDEQRAQREQADWDLEHNATTEVEVVQNRHPGLTPEQATQKIIAAEVQKRRLAVLVKDAIAAAGLAEAEETAAATVTLAPTDLAAVVKVDEARASTGLGPFGGETGGLTVEELRNRASPPSTPETPPAPEV